MEIKGIEFRRLLSDLKSGHPSIYRALFKRIYNDDPRFSDWRLPLWDMGHFLARMPNFINGAKNNEGRRELKHHAGFAAQYIAAANKFDFPLFFIEPELFKACANSSIPKGLKISDLKLPFDGFTFVFPKGAFPTMEGDINFLTIAADLIGTKTIDLGWGQNLNCETADNALIVHTFFTKSAGDFTIRITDLIFSDTVPAFHEHCIEETGAPANRLFAGNDKAMDDTTMKICAIIPALLMAMECRPDVIERERLVKQLRRDRHVEIWEPNRIGRKFRIKLPDDGEAGSHASPRPHTRRGHFRFQPVGHSRGCICTHGLKLHYEGICLAPDCECQTFRLKRAEVKKIWIEPLLINFKHSNIEEEKICKN